MSNVQSSVTEASVFGDAGAEPLGNAEAAAFRHSLRQARNGNNRQINISLFVNALRRLHPI